MEICRSLKVIIGKLCVIRRLCLFLFKLLSWVLGAGKSFGFEDIEGLYIVHQSCYRFIKFLIKQHFLALLLMTKCFDWEDLWWLSDVTRRPELVLEPSVLVSPPVAGSVLFGNLFRGGLVILPPGRGAVPSR